MVEVECNLGTAGNGGKSILLSTKEAADFR